MPLDIGAFLGGHVGPIPMWAIVGVGGVGAAIFLPKLLGSFKTSSAAPAVTDTGAPTDSSGLPPAPPGGPTPPAPPAAPPSPPTPAPSLFRPAPAQPIGGGPQNEPPAPGPFHRMPPQPTPQPVPPGVTPTKNPLPPQPLPGRPPSNKPGPGAGGPSGPAQPVHQYIHPTAWPSTGSTLSGIASMHGLPLSRLESLNAWIHQERGTWDAIYPADEIRIA